MHNPATVWSLGRHLSVLRKWMCTVRRVPSCTIPKSNFSGTRCNNTSLKSMPLFCSWSRTQASFGVTAPHSWLLSSDRLSICHSTCRGSSVQDASAICKIGRFATATIVHVACIVTPRYACSLNGLYTNGWHTNSCKEQCTHLWT